MFQAGKLGPWGDLIGTRRKEYLATFSFLAYGQRFPLLPCSLRNYLGSPLCCCAVSSNGGGMQGSCFSCVLKKTAKMGKKSKP